jgi:hypothetical protein
MEQEKRGKIDCYRTQRLDLGQECTKKRKKYTHKYCGNRKIALPLHRQKVNRLFRLVVIDLGF